MPERLSYPEAARWGRILGRSDAVVHKGQQKEDGCSYRCATFYKSSVYAELDERARKLFADAYADAYNEVASRNRGIVQRPLK